MAAAAIRPAALLAFGRLSYAFYMSFAVAELVLVNLFRQRGWAPAGHPFCVRGRHVRGDAGAGFGAAGR